jgi:hypothetical protein
MIPANHFERTSHMAPRRKVQKVAPHSRGTGALPIAKYAAAYGVHPTTVWRALRDGRLEYVVVNKRRLVLPPVVQRNDEAG